MTAVIHRLATTTEWSDHYATFYQDGRVVRMSHNELDLLARRAAAWLLELGVEPGDRIGILARNRLEWVALDLAAIKLHVVTAGFEYGAFTPTAELLSRYGLKKVFTDQPTDLHGFVDLRLLTTAAPSAPHTSAAARYDGQDVTTIKFTSGSTGRPKGLAATVASIDSSLEAVQEAFTHGADDCLLVFLPLSLLQQRYWVYSALCYGHDVVVTNHELSAYACKKERPTVIMGVPSFFDALKHQIQSRAAMDPGADADAALKQAARELTGGRIRYLWTGSAPAQHDTLRFFDAAGLPIYEGYGMNETCIVTKNTPAHHRFGSVGKPLRGKELFLDERGVLIVRSAHPVNRRYLFCDSPEAQAIFRDNGDVVTGDLATIDDDGFVYIKGRADDVVSLGNGKNVFTRPLEDLAIQSKAISHCVLFGAGQAHLVAVISPASDPADHDAINSHVAWINQRVNPHERIGAVVIADRTFSAEDGVLSSQGKPKRARIRELYEAQLQRAYRGGS